MLKQLVKRVSLSFEWKFLFCTILVGLFCGMISLFFWQTTIASFGISFPTIISLFLVCALFFDLGWNQAWVKTSTTKRTLVICLSTLFVWVAAYPFLCTGLWKSFSLLSSEFFSSDMRLLFPVSMAMVILLGIPSYLTGRLPGLLCQFIHTDDCEKTASNDRPENIICSIFFGSCAFGLFLGLALFTGMTTHYGIVLWTSLVTGLLLFPLLRTLSNPKCTESAKKKTFRLDLSTWKYLTASVLVGAFIAVLAQIVTQIWPSFAQQIYSRIGMILFGLSIGFLLVNWWKKGLFQSQQYLSLFVLFCLVLFPVFVQLVLQSNTLISNGSGMLIFRALATGFFFVPAGLVWAFSLDHSTESEKPQLNLFCLISGYLAGTYFLTEFVTLKTFLATLIVLQLVLLFIDSRKELVSIPKTGFALLPGLLCLIAVLIPPVTARFSPEMAAKKLFSTRVMLAYNAGVSSDQLDQIDESRLIEKKNSWYGNYTLWKTFGSQIQIRKNGYPFGVVSQNPVAFPQYTGEVFRTVFPLILHEHPRSLLIEGNGSGVSLQTALSFPVQEIICIEEDPQLISLMKEYVWKSEYNNPRSDKRVTIENINPQLMMAMNGPGYDVILSNPEESSLLKSGSNYTARYYETVRNRLSEDGLFCQYFRATEYGANPVVGLFQTFKSSFKHSFAVEIAANEYLLLGTDSDSGLIRSDLISRLQANHVREVLTQIGWDWSVPLNLRTYQLDKVKFSRQLTLNNPRNNWFAFEFPKEVVRWGNKPKEVVDGLTKASTRLVDLPGIDNQDPQIVRRMQEVISQFEIMSKNPDRPEAYRKILKKQLLKPRLAMIEQVNYEEGQESRLHPIEEHRKSYFQALGDAVTKRTPERELIQNVANHLAPYDPLLTYFAHHEIAELLERTGEDPYFELQCRLHMVYFSNGHDYSVRNIIAALKLLNEHTELTATSEERFDLINGLLQQLKHRWELRSHAPELKPEIALNDVNFSTEAIDQSFAQVDEIVPVQNFSKEDWTVRKKYLEKKLLRPLHTYRTSLLPKAQQRKSLINEDKVSDEIEKELEELSNPKTPAAQSD